MSLYNESGYPSPTGYSVAENVSNARNYASTHSVAETYVWFFNQVNTGGPQDYKQLNPGYEPLGNWNYGVVGRALEIPEFILARMAGAAQIASDIVNGKPTQNSKPWSEPPYGDHPEDQVKIREGVEWYNHNYPLAPEILPTDAIRIPLAGGVPLYVVVDAVNTAFTSARNWTALRDPLVLDLDGDGIEAIGINPLAPILFDMDADTVKTGTGWIKADDGFVVRDINGNGLIDSGRELFGDATILTRTSNPRVGEVAANGFDALADLDGNIDGKIDSADAVYSQLRIWQDTNQDGISQAGELKTLAELGIASINVQGTPSNTSLGNGNTQVLTGGFTRINGSTGTAGVAELSGSLLLASNNFYRQFADDPATTAAAQALPQMRGSGMVRDLRPAMSLGNAQALDLQAKLSDRKSVV